MKRRKISAFTIHGATALRATALASIIAVTLVVGGCVVGWESDEADDPTSTKSVSLSDGSHVPAVDQDVDDEGSEPMRAEDRKADDNGKNAGSVYVPEAEPDPEPWHGNDDSDP